LSAVNNDYSTDRSKAIPATFSIESIQDKETIKKLRTDLEGKVEMLSKFNKLMKVKYDELKQVKADSQSKDSKITELTNKLAGLSSLEKVKS